MPYATYTTTFPCAVAAQEWMETLSSCVLPLQVFFESLKC